jgi:hypothetical protein
VRCAGLQAHVAAHFLSLVGMRNSSLQAVQHVCFSERNARVVAALLHSVLRCAARICSAHTSGLRLVNLARRFWKIWRGVVGKISRPMFFNAIVVLPRLGGSNSQPHGRDSALSAAVLILPPPSHKSFILLFAAHVKQKSFQVSAKTPRRRF